MAKPSTIAKHKYNRLAYRRYEISVRVDTKLNYILERYAQNPKNSLSTLIKDLLAEYFDIDPSELYYPYHFRQVNGEYVEIPNTELDSLFKTFSL